MCRFCIVHSLSYNTQFDVIQGSTEKDSFTSSLPTYPANKGLLQRSLSLQMVDERQHYNIKHEQVRY